MKWTKLKEKISSWHYGILAVIFVIACVFRFVAIDWGMPHTNLHPDEGIIFGQAYQCALDRTFEVREYYRPNHVTIKLSTLLYVGIQELYFAPQGLEDFALNYSENTALFVTASRVLIALFSMGTVLFVYLIVRMWGKSQALLASLLIAIFPSFIEHSHYITPDIPLLFFYLGVVWAALKYLQKPSINWLFWMSFFTAMATCEKYPGAYGCVIIAIAVCTAHIKKPLRIVKDGLVAIAFFVLGIMAISPVLIVDYKTVLEIMAGQNKEYHLGADGLNFGQTLWYYTKTTGEHIGLIMTICGLYGIVRAVKKNTKPTIILLGFLAYIFPISVLSLHWERYTLPIYAGMLMFGAIGAFYLVEDLYKVLQKSLLISIPVYLLVFFLPVGSLTAGAMAMTGKFLAPDSRIMLQEVVGQLGMNVNNTQNDCNTPLDPGGFYGAWINFVDGDPTLFKYGAGPKFIMTSSAQRDLYLESELEVYGWIANFYRTLDEDYPLVFHYEVENPESYFLEVQNIYCSARTIVRYLRGTATGYDIRVYQLLP